MSGEAPKRWDRSRRRERDRKLAWKAFWFFVAVFVLSGVYWILRMTLLARTSY